MNVRCERPVERGMKPTLLALALVSSVPAFAQAQVSIDVDLPLLTFSAPPPLVVVQPGVQVVPDCDDEVFFVDGYYWARRGPHWYRTASWSGGWSYWSTPPASFAGYHPGAYRRWRPNHWRGGPPPVVVNPYRNHHRWSPPAPVYRPPSPPPGHAWRQPPPPPPQYRPPQQWQPPPGQRWNGPDRRGNGWNGNNNGGWNNGNGQGHGGHGNGHFGRGRGR